MSFVLLFNLSALSLERALANKAFLKLREVPHDFDQKIDYEKQKLFCLYLRNIEYNRLIYFNYYANKYKITSFLQKLFNQTSNHIIII